MRGFREYRWEFGLAIAGLVLIHYFVFQRAFFGPQIDAQNASQFGQFIGGYVGSIFGLGTVILLISTLRRQIAQNRNEGFEKRFFQLLDYHRENVAEIGVGRRSGRRTFVTLIREFRATLEIVRTACAQHQTSLTPIKLINLTYMAFYYGTGPNSTRVLISSAETIDRPLLDHVVKMLEQADKRRIQIDLKLAYLPFEGHQSRLGHYFRHLYQMVCYIDDNAKERAQEFAGLLRAQLSNHEQALLCLNSLSTIGAAWKTRGLIVRYHMIKNIPKDFFNPNTELDVPSVYPEVEFEYKIHTREQREPNRDIA
jgi:hypothetical protein